eukprot:7617129-Pyramimonas_sp.AAC.1
MPSSLIGSSCRAHPFDLPPCWPVLSRTPEVTVEHNYKSACTAGATYAPQDPRSHLCLSALTWGGGEWHGRRGGGVRPTMIRKRRERCGGGGRGGRTQKEGEGGEARGGGWMEGVDVTALSDDRGDDGARVWRGTPPPGPSRHLRRDAEG